MAGLYERLSAYLSSHKKAEPEAQESSLYPKLSEQLEDEAAGFSPLDLVVLGGLQKDIMLLLLRDTEAALDGVTLAAMQEHLSKPADDIAKALADLTRHGWLITLGDPPRLRYRIHMRRKRGSSLGLGIWSALDNRLT